MFCSLAYYRVPNLLLFAALAFYFVRNIRQKNWLMVALGICVQSWYIFSYTTADALDFTIAFAITCLLCNRRVCFIAPWKRKNYAGEIFLLFFF